MRFSQLSKRTNLLLAGLIILAFSVVSCQKELSGDGFNTSETPPDLTTKVSSSVSGFVTDENDAPVNGASVQVGLSSTTTDKYGYFEVSNAQVIRNAAVVTVLKPGYFKGIKTYIATTGKPAFFRIKLLPRNSAGSFDAAAGGTVALSNGLSVTFPANAVVTEAGGTAYTGAVNVAAQWINPIANDLHRVMPGDLRGLDSLGYMRHLTTYGMAAVELTGTGGEGLQLAPGKKATLVFPIPSSIRGSAPATLPLWSFDETKGLWKEEGYALKSGSNYTGEVSHFSFWNCDVPGNFVQFSCTLVNSDGAPVTQVLVKISMVDNPQNVCWGYVNSAGYVGGAIPKNAQLLMEVFSQYGCSSPDYTQNITATDIDLNLGTITLPSIGTANVKGTVTNCSATPLISGYVVMLKDNFFYRYLVSPTGTFSFTTTLCNNTPLQVQLVAEDHTTLQAGDPQTFTLNAGANNAGILSACGTSFEQFIKYSINDTPYILRSPIDNFWQYVNNVQDFLPLLMYVRSNPPAGSVTGFAALSFNYEGIAAGSAQALVSFACSELGSTIPSPITLNITEFGAIGQFIAGNFTGVVARTTPYNTLHNITCSFRVRRQW